MNIMRVKIFFCALMLSAFASCSMPRILYNNADFLVLNWFDSYFELNEQQRSDLKKGIEKFFNWHRKSELPKMVLFLEELRVRYNNGISEDDVKWTRAQAKDFLEGVLHYFEDDLVSLFLTIEESQVLHMKTKLLERDDDLIKYSKMDSLELHEKVLDWFYETLEDWLGDLEPDQKQKIAKWVKPDFQWITIKLKNRKKFRNDLASLLQSKESLKENLHAWIYHLDSHWTDEFKVHVESKKQEWIDIFLKVDAITLPGQRKHGMNELQEYVDNFKSLAKK